MNYAIGILAGIMDGLGWLRLRDAVYDLPGKSGSRIDGFDRAADWFLPGGAS